MVWQSTKKVKGGATGQTEEKAKERSKWTDAKKKSTQANVKAFNIIFKSLRNSYEEKNIISLGWVLLLVSPLQLELYLRPAAFLGCRG